MPYPVQHKITKAHPQVQEATDPRAGNNGLALGQGQQQCGGQSRPRQEGQQWTGAQEMDWTHSGTGLMLRQENKYKTQASSIIII